MKIKAWAVVLDRTKLKNPICISINNDYCVFCLKKDALEHMENFKRLNESLKYKVVPCTITIPKRKEKAK